MTSRPSFHESWYRVAELRPRLRTTVQTHRQMFRGRRWHVVQDASNNQYFRVDEAAYHFIALLDGRRTIEEAWAICQEQFDDAAPTQGEAIQLLGQLYVSNLLQSDLPADAAGMFEEQQSRTRREVGGFARSLLFMRIPLFDPDALLGRWERVFGFLFGPVGLVAWVLLVITGLVTVAGRVGELAGDVFTVVAPRNLFLLYLSFAAIKALHELGHGLAAKRLGRLSGTGGEVHRLGITLLVLTPVPYVDASCAWSFPSKWHRAIVGAAGMYVDLAVAAVAAMIWANTSPGLVHAIAYNIILVASVSTLLFNGNPLLKFDGYYILSDILEIPNLAQRSREHLIYLVKRWVFGLPQAVSPVTAPGEARLLPLYGVLAGLYRVVVMFGIVLVLCDLLPGVGLFLAVLTLGSWVITPVVGVVRYLASSPELARVRSRACLTSMMIGALVFILVGIIPLPDRAKAEGVLEPKDVAIVHAAVDGFVEDFLPSGTHVAPGGTPLVVMRNDDLVVEREMLLADHALTELSRDRARGEEVSRAQSLTHKLHALEERIERVDQQLAATAVDAPIAGRWLAPEIDRQRGAFVRTGDEIGMVASVDRLLIRAVADQNLGPRIEPEAGRGALVRVRVLGRPDLEFTGRIRDILPAGFRQLPSAALGYQAGGATAVTGEDQTGTRTVDAFFEAHIEIVDNDDLPAVLCSGQRVVVRFEMPSRPLILQAWRAARQLVQQRLGR